MMQPIQPAQASTTTLNESVAGDVCEWFGAHRLDERLLCQECYADSGSCCPEFGKDDLWTFDDEDQSESGQASNRNRQ